MTNSSSSPTKKAADGGIIDSRSTGALWEDIEDVLVSRSRQQRRAHPDREGEGMPH